MLEDEYEVLSRSIGTIRSWSFLSSCCSEALSKGGEGTDELEKSLENTSFTIRKKEHVTRL